MSNEIYKNRILYYNFMKDFLEGDISPWKFKKKYWSQRNEDLDEDQKNEKIKILNDNEKKFNEQYSNLGFLYDNNKGNEVLKEYEQGAKKLNISGEIFFDGIFEFIDLYVKDYYPSDDEGFDPIWNIDEQTLAKRIQMAFDVLERNKDRWMIEEKEIKEEQSQYQDNNGLTI